MSTRPRTLRTKSELQTLIQSWKDEGLSVAFVPTMGALHEGHLSLVTLALEEADRCVVSIFVNPTQFAPDEDFESYPRKEETDSALLAKAGAHVIYFPTREMMYPDGVESSTIKAGQAAHAGLEDRFRPTHFDGVVNIVARLLEHVKPDIAIFGEKDYQQLQVLREMVSALNSPVKITGAPIVRDAHGLALSSRNAYLGVEALDIARMLNQIMYKAAFDIEKNMSAQEIENIEKTAQNMLLTCGFDKVDYVTFKPEWNRVLVAAYIGQTRLIDNVSL